MKNITLIRHAKSSWDHPDLPDIDRPLGPRGLRDAPVMADFLHKKNPNIDLWLTSPSERTKATAKFFQAAFGLDESAVLTLEELYHASADQLLGIVRGISATVSTVAIFGHNPGLTDFANLLCHDADYIENIPTCAIVGISFPVNDWRMVKIKSSKREFFYLPRKIVKQNENDR